MKAIVPAAGLGTRFLAGTKCIPKELLPVLNKPVLQYVVEGALAPESVDECIIVSSHQKPQSEEYFSRDLDLEGLLINKDKVSFVEDIKQVASLPFYLCTTMSLRA